MSVEHPDRRDYPYSPPFASEGTPTAPTGGNPAAVGGTGGAAGLSPSEQVVARTLVSLRWAGFAVTTAVLVVSLHQLQRPVLAVGVTGLALAWTVLVTVLAGGHSRRLHHRVLVGTEVGLAAVMLAADGWVYGTAHTWEAPALGAVWPLAAVMAAGAAFGWSAGALTGVAVASARLLGALAPDAHHHTIRTLDRVFDPGPARLLPTAGLVAIYLLAGAGAGQLSRLQRTAEAHIATASARRDVARSLHDGVLQSLAVIARRSPDPDLARLALDADRDLRVYLSTDDLPAATNLGAALHACRNDIARRHDIDPRLALDPELPDRPAPITAALIGAVTEALTNTAKHADARTVTVYAAPHDTAGVTVTVTDDGAGFDPERQPAGRGITQSIIGRLADVGGTVTIRSTPGDGCEVSLWVP